MNKRIYPFISLITALLIIAAACTSEVVEPIPGGIDYFTIDLSTIKISPRSVSSEPGDTDGEFNENKIDDLDIFFYEGNALKWHVNSLTYNAGTQIATIPITADKRALFLDNTTVAYDIYVVANNSADLSLIAEGADNLQALKDIVFQTPSFVSDGGSTAQSSFVMDGVIAEKVVNLNDPHLGTVSLKRAASKIRLKVIDVNVPFYELDGTITAQLVHFTDKSALMEGGTAPAMGSDDWKNSPTRNLTSLDSDDPATTAAPFYAYTNDWSTDKNRETYLELYVPLKKTGEDVVHNYKYRVPVTPRGLTGENVQYMNKLQRNFLYDIGVTVKILGSREEPSVELSGNYIIKDWSTQEILVNITGAHYLVVSERHVIMPNISTYTLQFNSSIPNVTLVDGSLKATYTYVPAGSSSPTTVDVVSDQQPTVTVQPNIAAGTIIINSPVPVNYIPKDIEFKATNGTLTETITVQQLPATYFTVTKGVASYLPDEGNRTSLPSGNNNPYMYTITTLAPTGDVIWGFPPTDSQGQTINSEEVSKMVSPKFEMASQFGAVQRKNYVDGQRQCRGYTETAEDGTIKTGWRLPTAAEIHYIDVIQQTAPTEYVMRGAFYWSNWSQYPTSSGNGAYRMGVNVPAKNHDDSYNTGATYNSAHVRCIRDIKD